ncbi:hypothetical protein Zmor_025223 [Zophobas morio]|uniref:C2H2-type domain-containing protein n=1 Tax=Zophobas morio TaxID=2755281 RepID=A0AA38HRK5_9CUCU|nr:hypothetical protein Zmor_025223 [Zophobas morio]
MAHGENRAVFHRRCQKPVCRADETNKYGPSLWICRKIARPLFRRDKPHACDLCNKKFALACNLRAHMKTHEGDPQEECTRCGKMYICNGTPDACPKCRGQNGAPHGDSAEDSSGNHTEDSNTPE